MKQNKPSKRIYIRHADKEYANGDASMYKHDPGITDVGCKKAAMMANHLIDRWGIPNLIIVSPYRRTRETAIAMRSVIKKLKPDLKVQISIDTSLSEYLGNHRAVPIDVTESTMVYNPPHPESFTEMVNRVKTHHNNITGYMEKRSGLVIWVITHGLIMRQVAKLAGIRMAKEFPNLTCLSVSDGDRVTKGEVIIPKENMV